MHFSDLNYALLANFKTRIYNRLGMEVSRLQAASDFKDVSNHPTEMKSKFTLA